MELPLNDVVKQGELRFKGKMGMWQRQYVLLKKASSKGGRRMERYGDERSSRHGQSVDKPIELDSVTSVTQLPPDIKKHALAIVFKDNTSRSFCCESEAQASAWIAALQSLCLSASPQQTVSSIDLLQSGPSQKELTELFNVYLLPSLNLAFYGECMLQVTQENVHLLETNNVSNRLVTWPLTSLRRYGSDDNKFTFESGRSCQTGEGIFIMTTKDGDAIYKKVHAATLAIAEMANVESWQRQNQRRHTEPALIGLGGPTSPPLRSLSTPEPNPNGPNPCSRQPGMGQQRLRKSSAVNLALPPVPNPAAPARGFELFYDDVGGPPAEDAPIPPQPLSPTRGGGYLPMTAHLEQDEYVGLKDRNDSNYISIKGPQYVNQNQRDPAGPGVSGTTGKEEDYLYAEKDLTRAFRSYLKERKVDD